MAGLSVERVRANLAAVRTEIAAAAQSAGRDPADVELLAATKYVAAEDLPALAQAGIALVGENRAQDLAAKVEAHGGLFTWDFIGHLQSRKVKQVLPHVRLIHSVASDSVLRELERHAHAGDGGARRGQRRGRGGQERGDARASSAPSSRAARCGSRG